MDCSLIEGSSKDITELLDVHPLVNGKLTVLWEKLSHGSVMAPVWVGHTSGFLQDGSTKRSSSCYSNGHQTQQGGSVRPLCWAAGP